MTGDIDFFAGRAGLGVHQRRKLLELRNQYTLTDETGAPAGVVEQRTQAALAFAARLLTAMDTMLPTTLDVYDADEQPVLQLHKPWFTWRVTAARPDGRVIGSVNRRLRIGRPVYEILDAEDRPGGEIRGEDWRSRNFGVTDASGVEVARVTKQWRGLLTEALTDADTYAVTFAETATPEQRALAFAGCLTVDLIQKQKDAGGGIGGALSS